MLSYWVLTTRRVVSPHLYEVKTKQWVTGQYWHENFEMAIRVDIGTDCFTASRCIACLIQTCMKLYTCWGKKKLNFFSGGGGAYGHIIGRIYFYVSMKRRNGYLCPANLKCISIMHIFTLGFFIIYGTRHVFKFYGPSRLLYSIKLKLHHDRTRLYIISDKIKYLV